MYNYYCFHSVGGSTLVVNRHKPLQVAPPHAVGLVIKLGLVITSRKVFLPTASELAEFCKKFYGIVFIEEISNR